MYSFYDKAEITDGYQMMFARLNSSHSNMDVTHTGSSFLEVLDISSDVMSPGSEMLAALGPIIHSTSFY